MGLYQHLTDTFQSEYKGESNENYDYKKIYREKLMEFRKFAPVVRIDKPSNLARARNLGYKAKQGYVVARVRVRRGSGIHKRPITKRKPKRMGVNKLTRKISIQAIAEQRAARRFENLEVLNSYKVGADGRSHYFEVILVDPHHPVIASDRHINWLLRPENRGRVFRGKTSAGKKYRGIARGKGNVKNMPSLRAHNRKGK